MIIICLFICCVLAIEEYTLWRGRTFVLVLCIGNLKFTIGGYLLEARRATFLNFNLKVMFLKYQEIFVRLTLSETFMCYKSLKQIFSRIIPSQYFLFVMSVDNFTMYCS